MNWCVSPEALSPEQNERFRRVELALVAHHREQDTTEKLVSGLLGLV